MAIHDLFSKRRKRERGQVPDVFKYDDVPKELRAQIIHILMEAFGDDQTSLDSHSEKLYAEIRAALAREYGAFSLTNRKEPREDFFQFILTERGAERVLDAVELSCRVLLNLPM